MFRHAGHHLLLACSADSQFARIIDVHSLVEQNFEDLTRLLAGAADANEVIERLSTSRDAEGPAAGDDVTVVALRRSGDAETSGISLTQRKKQRRAAPAKL